MSMYGELVKLASDELEDGRRDLRGPALVTELEHDLGVRRQALTAARLRAAGDPSRAIAAEVGYDAALLALARELGVAADPARFRSPAAGRADLEAALADRGVDVGALGSAAAPAH